MLVSILVLSSCGSTQSTSSEAEDTTVSAETEAETGSTEDITSQLKTMEIAEDFAGGDGSEEDPYQIETAEQLMLFAEYCADPDLRGSSFVLTQDIVFNSAEDIAAVEDLSDIYGWTATDSWFEGVFDGGGHTISGLYIVPSSTSDAGLIGKTDGATIKDLKIENTFIYAEDVTEYSVDAGSIVGSAADTVIQNCSADSTILCRGAEYAGGIVGNQSRGSVENCSFSGTILLTEDIVDAGGIVGMAYYCDLLSCTSQAVFQQQGEGDIQTKIGGIAAVYQPGEDSVISDCVNQGDISVSDSSVAGLINTLYPDQVSELENLESGVEYSAASLHITGCSNEGNIETDVGDDQSAGGLIAYIYNSYDRESGTGQVFIEDCVNSGSVTGIDRVGGIVGEVVGRYASVTITECRNEGAVSGETYIGGIIGMHEPAAREHLISGCVNSGSVYASEGANGGIIGFYGVSISVSEEDAARLTVEDCVNEGRVSNGEGILGTAGILGHAEPVTNTTDTLLLTGCVNEGEIAGGTSARVGGILGGSSMGTMAVIQIVDCGNGGTLSIGDGQRKFTTSLNLLNSEDYSAEDAAAQSVGGGSIGGIAGYARLCLIDGCVNAGEIYIDSETDVFGGAICGMYFYLEEEEFYSAETSALTNCVYSDEIETAYDTMKGSGEETVSNVTAVSASEALEQYEKLK